MAVLSNLEPKAVFEYFEKLCAVPHGSFAKELGLKWRQDALNNVVIWKGGTPGYEDAEPVILQGHMDMVCAKTEQCDKDMAREGLDLATDGEYVWAEETSLGGDNCIAVAMALALLADKTMPHPPLEAVFTVDEEVGMEGAFGLDCAGGVRMDCRLPSSRGPLTGETGYAVTISGLQGGHSGADIDKGRASANVLAGRVLYSAMERVPGLRLADVRGGKFDNVICPFNVAKVAVPAEKEAEFEAFIREFDGVLKNEYAGCDEGVTLVCQRTAVETALSPEDTHRILRTLLVLPQGVQAMNADFPGLVQTSLNLGVMSVEADGLHLTLSIRSCIASQKAMLCQRVRAVIETGGGTAEERSGYPGWQYQRESAMRQRLMEVYRDLNGKDAVIEATHGGLECGLFIEKLPGLDAVSLGPELRDIHSPRERLGVASTERVYRLVCEFLKRSK